MSTSEDGSARRPDPAGRPEPGALGVRMVHDRVLFAPEARGEVELDGREYLLLRERDLHAVAQADERGGRTGLYL